MAFTSTSGSQMVDMNVTPLVDVMLVMLIIFMVTVPAITYQMQVVLPHKGPTPKVVPPDPIRVHIGASGSVNWNGSPMSLAMLQERFAAEGTRGLTAAGVIDPTRQPAIEIQADRDADYDVLAKVLSRAKNANLAKVIFVESAAR